jgi:hypothetical protein
MPSTQKPLPQASLDVQFRPLESVDDPGETITIQFMIWDTGDHDLDSTVLVDNWKWEVEPTTGPATGRPR